MAPFDGAHLDLRTKALNIYVLLSPDDGDKTSFKNNCVPAVKTRW
jgi:hypothetical protein